MTSREQLLAEIAATLAPGSVDELRAFRVIARRVMGKGRENYGPTDLANDTRNFKDEKALEKLDWIWYQALDEVSEYDERVNDTPTGEYRPVIADTASGAIPTTWAAELGDAPIEIAVARTDSSEFENVSGQPCEDCAAMPGAHHRAGCEWTVVVEP